MGAREDTTIPGLVVAGVAKARTGMILAAEEALAAIGRQPRRRQRKYEADIAVLTASIAGARGEWGTVVRELEPLTIAGRTSFVVYRLPIRWLVAEALENLGRDEEAAAAYELVIDPLRLRGIGYLVRPSYVALAHCRLAPLYARLGRPDEARRHWQSAQAMITTPDPVYRELLATARAAVAVASGRPSDGHSQN